LELKQHFDVAYIGGCPRWQTVAGRLSLLLLFDHKCRIWGKLWQ